MPKFTTSSQYLRVSDLPANEDTIVTIESFSVETMRQDEKTVKKWVLKFVGLERALALNDTNGNKLIELFGDEMDLWVGKTIVLYIDHAIKYNGSTVSGIRVRAMKEGS